MSDSIKSSSVSRYETDGLSKFGLRNFAEISYHVLALSVFSFSIADTFMCVDFSFVYLGYCDIVYVHYLLLLLPS